MQRNEVGNDGAAPAVANTAAEGSLYNQITDALSDPKTLAVIGGTALAAAAAVKFGRPLLEMGKAAVPMGDDAVLAAIREASKGTPQGETTVLGVVRGNRIEPATDALLNHSIPISSSVRDLSKALNSLELAFAQGVMERAERAAMAGKLASKVDAPLIVEKIRREPLVTGAADAILRKGVPIENVGSRVRPVSDHTGIQTSFDLATPPRFDPKIALDHAGYSLIPPMTLPEAIRPFRLKLPTRPTDSRMTSDTVIDGILSRIDATKPPKA